VRAKKPLRPIWTTTVDPSEYDYVAQFTQTVKWANKNKENHPPTDVGKVWGLVQAYQRLERENAALRKAALALISELDVEAFDRVGRPKGEMLYEHVGPLRAAVNAARAKEGGAT